MKNFCYYLRLLKIIFIFYKNDALFFIKYFKIAPIYTNFLSLISFKNNKLRDGEKLAKTLQELGPIFIKAGQVLSTRSDILGDKISSDLSKLQDKLPNFAFDIVKNTIESEFNAKLEDLFIDFDPKPIAAASIAQVHKAKLHDGKNVAVKILRPHIRKIFKKDINLLYFIAKVIDKKSQNSKFIKPIEIIKYIEFGIKNELDLNIEAAAASELKENLANNDKVYIPEVYWHLTSNDILTTEWIEGISIYDTDKLIANNHNLQAIAQNLATLFFIQAYENGFFHADLHPGNILIDNKGVINLIDFGIMGRLDQKTKLYVAEILHGFLTRDYNKIAQIHFDAGYISQNKSMRCFAQACRTIGEPIASLPSNKVSIAKLFSQMMKIINEYEIPADPQLLILQKTMFLVEGIGMKLNPTINIWKLAEPWMQNWALHNISIEARLFNSVKRLIKNISKKIIEEI